MQNPRGTEGGTAGACALKSCSASNCCGSLLTATPVRSDGLTPILEMGLGKMLDTNDQSGGGGQGSEREIVHVKIINYDGGERREIKNKAGFLLMPIMINSLAKDIIRTIMVTREIVQLYQEGHQVIVLSDRIDQLNAICNELVKNVPEDKIAYYFGKTPAKERLVAASRQILLATYSMAKEGLDIPTLSACVFATPIGSVEQAVGRIQRPCDTKKKPVVCVDIVDTFSIFLHMATKRRKLYKQHGFSIDQTF